MIGFSLGLILGIAAGGAVIVLLRRREAVIQVNLERRAARAERLAELGMLTGGLAHEIKNPLSTVQLNLQLLREDLADQTPTAEAEKKAVGRMLRRLESLSGETVRLREILDDFLRYAGQIHPESQRTNMMELCEDLIDFVMPQAQLGRVELKLRGEPVAAEVDPRLIKQALLNLLLNALQHTPADGRVTLHCNAADLNHQPGIALRVIDTGEGMDDETRGRVLDPYFSKRRGGTGLGLAIVRRIAEAHHGYVGVDSEPGQGSTFSLLLPVKQPQT